MVIIYKQNPQPFKPLNTFIIIIIMYSVLLSSPIVLPLSLSLSLSLSLAQSMNTVETCTCIHAHDMLLACLFTSSWHVYHYYVLREDQWVHMYIYIYMYN